MGVYVIKMEIQLLLWAKNGIVTYVKSNAYLVCFDCFSFNVYHIIFTNLLSSTPIDG